MDGSELVFLKVGIGDKSFIAKLEIGEERELEDAVAKKCDKKKTRKIKLMRGGRRVQAKKWQDLKLSGMVEVHDGLAKLSGMAEVHGGLAELSGVAAVHDGLAEFNGMAEVQGGLAELAEWWRCTVVWQTLAKWWRCMVVWQTSAECGMAEVHGGLAKFTEWQRCKERERGAESSLREKGEVLGRMGRSSVAEGGKMRAKRKRGRREGEGKRSRGRSKERWSRFKQGKEFRSRARHLTMHFSATERRCPHIEPRHNHLIRLKHHCRVLEGPFRSFFLSSR